MRFRFKIAAGAAAAAFACMSHASETFLVHSQARSCSDIAQLDIATGGGNDGFFAGWIDQDFQDAITWASACKGHGQPFADDSRIQRIQHVREVFASQRRREEIRARDAAEQAAAAARRASEAEQRAAAASAAEEKRVREANSRATRQTCMDGQAYSFYFAEQEVVSFREELAELKSEQARERLVSREAGVRNLSNEYALGSKIVEVKEQLQDRFERYRAGGGKAKSIAAVKATAPDPCPPAP